MSEHTKTEMDKVYDPKKVEQKWYEDWVSKGYYKSSASNDKPPFTIVIPPPNVTGSLHIGHALNNTLQDILIRYKRMKGFEKIVMLSTCFVYLFIYMLIYLIYKCVHFL